MIIVTGTIVASPESLDNLLAISLEHVRRSRAEAGCLEHGVYQDAENSLRLVFFERWADAASLATHFALPASRQFVKAARELASGPPEMSVYEAASIDV
jgi:quinol monooxygenase YgiN